MCDFLNGILPWNDKIPNIPVEQKKNEIKYNPYPENNLLNLTGFS